MSRDSWIFALRVLRIIAVMVGIGLAWFFDHSE